MGNILVYLQHSSYEFQKASLCALDAAQQIKQKHSKDSIHAICLGAEAKTAANACKLEVASIYYSEDPSLEKYIAAPYAAAVLAAAKDCSADTIVMASSSIGKDFAPHLAVGLNAGQASDIIGVNDNGSLRRPMYAGDVFADVELTTENKIITVRATAFNPASAAGASPEVKELSFDAPEFNYGEVVSYELSGGDRPELGDAEVVVSGGRALQSEENFQKYIFPLADALGAAVGASRAAVDSGYAPNDWQVGQTGKIVAPDLYIAVGISGAIQHLAGMKDSKVIVAINKDPDAPIYEIADYGLVADLYEVVLPLADAIKAAKSG